MTFGDWLGQIRQDFSKECAEVLQDSPTLVELLSSSRFNQVILIAHPEIEGMNSGCTIFMKASHRPVRFCSVLRHELRHYEHPIVDCRLYSRDEYISKMLDNEADCMLKEAEVLDELLAKGHWFKYREDRIVRVHPEVRLERYRQWADKAVCMTSGQPVAEHYGKAWDIMQGLLASA